MNVCIIGLGYVGLTLALSMADSGIRVLGVDSKKETVSSLKRGISTISEKDSERILKRTLDETFFVFEKIPDKKIDAFIISVGTPLNENKMPIMDHVINASTEVGKNLKKEQMVILRSTIPVGTTREVVLPILEKESNLQSGEEFDVIFAPERTAEGVALSELKTNPQIIGSLNENGISNAGKLFKKMTPTIVPVSSLEAAEMIKLIDNTYRDVHFAYANEIAIICEMLNINAKECIEKANFNYPRNKIPIPSPGVGGPCLSKDPYILTHVASKFNYKPNLIIHSRWVNEFIPLFIAKKILKKLEKFKKNQDQIKIFILGFAFKGEPETGDIRNSSTLLLVDGLKEKYQTLYGFDPVVKKEEIEQLNVINVNVEKGIRNADCVIVMNNHKSYQNLNMKKLLSEASKPCLFVDCWSMFPEISSEENIIYTGVGID